MNAFIYPKKQFIICENAKWNDILYILNALFPFYVSLLDKFIKQFQILI